MKKILSLGLAFLNMFFVLSIAGCGKAEPLKMGFGIAAEISEIKNADGETNGYADTTATLAAVLVDKNGKIIKCAIDTAENPLDFTSDGKAVAAGDLLTKTEHGDNYGMKKSGAKKEWYEQKDAFIAVVVGKTIDEVKALEKDGKGTDEVVNAGCTINITNFVLALDEAVKNAAESEATADDTLQVSIVTSQTDMKDATDVDMGKNEFSLTFVAIAINSTKKVTASKTDALSFAVEFDDKGVSESEFGKDVTTKRDAGDDYGMKKAGAKKEWYAQADAFDAQIVGKTANGIKDLSDNTGKAVEDLVTAGCTINVADMIKAAVKAASVK